MGFFDNNLNLGARSDWEKDTATVSVGRFTFSTDCSFRQYSQKRREKIAENMIEGPIPGAIAINMGREMLRFDVFRPLYYGWDDYLFEALCALLYPVKMLLAFAVEQTRELVNSVIQLRPDHFLVHLVCTVIGGIALCALAAYSIATSVLGLIVRPIITVAIGIDDDAEYGDSLPSPSSV
jgi:hypothetical protein